MAGGGSVYAQKASAGGSVYAQKGSGSGGSVYAGKGQSGASAPKKGGGILGAVEGAAHVVAQKADLAAHDLKAIPGGIVDVSKLEGQALAHDAHQLIHHPTQTQSFHDFLHGNSPASKKLAGVEGEYAKGSVESVRHPGRDPFQTLMTLLPLATGVAGAASRIGYAGDAIKAGETANAAKALLSPMHKPPVAPRLLNVEGSQVSLHPSSGALARAVQGGYDKVLQHGLDTRPEGKVAAHAQKRIGGALDESARAQQRMRDVPANALDQAAKRLTSSAPDRAVKKAVGAAAKGRVHQAALELTSVNTTAENAAKYHLGQAEKGVEPARNRVIAKLYQTVADRGLLTTNAAGDVIVNAAEHPKLAAADQALAKVQGRGDEILARYNVRPADVLQARTDAPGRVREGAAYETPTPAKNGVPSQSLLKAQARVARLQTLFDRASTKAEKVPTELPSRARAGLEKHLAQLGFHEDQIARGLGSADRMLVLHRTDPEKFVTYVARAAGKARPGQGKIADMVPRAKSAQHAFGLAARNYLDKIPATGERVPNPTADRLGGALSVAKDELQRLQDQAAARVKPTGMLGGETARPGRGFVSYATHEKKAPSSPAAASGGPVVGEAKAPITAKTFTGHGIEKGLVPDDVTGQAARHYRAIVRFVNTTERRNAAIRTGSDVRRSDRDVLVKVPGVDHAKLPDAIEEALGRKKATVDDINGLHAALEAHREDLIPGVADRFAADAQHPIGTSAADAAAARGLDAPEGYKWVDKGALGQLAHAPMGQRGWFAKKADTINSAVTAATVYFKVGHIGTRALTNASTNIIQGSAQPLEISRSLRLWDGLSTEDRLRALSASGQHGIAALPHEGTNAIARAATRGAGWWAKHIDAPFRFNSIAYEARKAGFDTPAKFREMLAKLENPHEHNMSAAERSKVMGVANRANREGIAYDRLSDFEKRYITRAFWFYPWVKGATSFAGNTLIEHPFKAAALGAAGVHGRQVQQQQLGDVPSYEGGLFKLGNKVADFSTFSPFATPADVLDAVARPAELSGFLNPVYAGANALINGLTPSGGKSTAPLKDALATALSPMPEAQILSGYQQRHSNQGRRMFPKSPAWYGTKDPLLRALLGPALPRKYNQTALHSAAARERTGR